VAHYWTVKIEDKARVELAKLLKSKVITKADIKVLLRWVSEMEELGPEYIATSKEWYDHELEREWKGYRSSAFSHSGRIIYRVFNDKIIVQVAKVTADHNYKK
jgi:mRNA-degrading endonuclease YafQ of YafQ-DinJ toxin-antitoxin module